MVTFGGSRGRGSQCWGTELGGSPLEGNRGRGGAFLTVSLAKLLISRPVRDPVSSKAIRTATEE